MHSRTASGTRYRDWRSLGKIDSTLLPVAPRASQRFTLLQGFGNKHNQNILPDPFSATRTRGSAKKKHVLYVNFYFNKKKPNNIDRFC